ncbi:MAG: cytochrome b/b6 domain-containing protein [Usitatibacter sp.]
MSAPFRYSRPLRAMHALIAFAMVAQMVLTLVMDHPSTRRPMRPVGAFYFQWHEWVGLAAFAILAINWIYRVAVWKRQGQRRLFPWLTRDGIAALGDELRDFFRLKWSAIPAEGALAGTIHGLGLLLATELAVTGLLLYILLWPANVVSPLARQLMEVHQFLGPAMWAYLAGHGAMAVWHQLSGDGSLARMFSLRS